MSPLLTALILTIFFEYLVLLFFFPKRWFNTLIFSILVNCLTLRPATEFYWQHANVYSWQHSLLGSWAFAISELAVVLVESVLIKFYFRIPYRKALLISFLANGLTAFISLLWQLAVM
jgi:hypothetical protein